MNDGNRFEIQSSSCGVAAERDDPRELPHNEQARPAASVISIDRAAAGWTFLGVDAKSGEIRRVVDRGQARAAVRVVARKLNDVLAMRTLAPGLLVNGLPALSLTALGPRDSVLLAPGAFAYITERIRPRVGQPGAEHLGKKCPVCKLKIEAATQIAVHRCNVAYHYETEASHPHVADEERLNCFTQIAKCLSCGREATLEETLVWDPSEML